MKRKLALAAALAALFFVLLPVGLAANSAEGPALTILVNNAPEDLELVLVHTSDRQDRPLRQSALWETQFSFYLAGLGDLAGWTLEVRTGGQVAEYPLTLFPLEGYRTVYTLNLSTGSITPGEAPWRGLVFTLLRLVLTLGIEALVFWLFRFRQRRSWAVFLAANLVTQGGLLFWVNSVTGAGDSAMIIIMLLVFLEVLFFAAEAIAYCLALHEHSRLRRVLCALCANAASYIVGIYVFALLPL